MAFVSRLDIFPPLHGVTTQEDHGLNLHNKEMYMLHSSHTVSEIDSKGAGHAAYMGA